MFGKIPLHKDKKPASRATNQENKKKAEKNPASEAKNSIFSIPLRWILSFPTDCPGRHVHASEMVKTVKIGFSPLPLIFFSYVGLERALLTCYIHDEKDMGGVERVA